MESDPQSNAQALEAMKAQLKQLTDQLKTALAPLAAAGLNTEGELQPDPGETEQQKAELIAQKTQLESQITQLQAAVDDIPNQRRPSPVAKNSWRRGKSRLRQARSSLTLRKHSWRVQKVRLPPEKLPWMRLLQN